MSAEDARGDETIVLLVVERGQAELFAVLYERHYRRIYRLAYGMTAQREAAEDLTQEVFLRAYRSLNRFRGEASFATWLHRLAINCCLNGCRRERLRNGEELRYADGAERGERFVVVNDHEANLEQHVLQNQIAKQVHGALQSLPPELRVIVVMRDIEGLSYEEIAMQLACSSGTVASRLSRARRLLARKLDGLRGQV